MHTIEVNNGGTLELAAERNGITLTSRDSAGKVERRDFFGDANLVMAANLLRYLRDNGTAEVYLLSEDMRLYLQNLIRSGDIEEYRIF